MPKLTASKDKILGLPPVPEAMYAFRLDGFEPKLSNKKDSTNLNPIMKITNHAEFNDRRIWENLNSKGEWVWKDFCHALGVDMAQNSDGGFDFPGNFICSRHTQDCDGSDPENWTYQGPLLGQIGQAYLIQADDTKGGVKNVVKYYVCRASNCSLKHSSNLAK